MTVPLFLSFVTMTLLKSTGQVLNRMSLNLGFLVSPIKRTRAPWRSGWFQAGAGKYQMSLEYLTILKKKRGGGEGAGHFLKYDAFSDLEWSSRILGGILQSLMCLPQCIISQGSWCWCLVNGDVNLDHSVRVVPAGFHHCKVTMFPFIICKYLGGDPLILFLLKLLLILAFMHWSCLQQLLLCCSNGDFSLALIPSAFITWDSSVRKNCPFSLVYLFNHY